LHDLGVELIARHGSEDPEASVVFAAVRAAIQIVMREFFGEEPEGPPVSDSPDDPEPEPEPKPPRRPAGKKPPDPAPA